MKKLTKNEMKMVMGGVAPYTEWTVNCTFKKGHTQTSPGGCEGNSKSLCEHEANVWCGMTEGCIECTATEVGVVEPE